MTLAESPEPSVSSSATPAAADAAVDEDGRLGPLPAEIRLDDDDDASILPVGDLSTDGVVEKLRSEVKARISLSLDGNFHHFWFLVVMATYRFKNRKGSLFFLSLLSRGVATRSRLHSVSI